MRRSPVTQQNAARSVVVGIAGVEVDKGELWNPRDFDHHMTVSRSELRTVGQLRRIHSLWNPSLVWYLDGLILILASIAEELVVNVQPSDGRFLILQKPLDRDFHH